MRVLITGTSGFVGTNLAEFLSKTSDLQVFGFDRVKPKEAFAHVKYYQVDLLKRGELAEIFGAVAPDVVIHAAAQARVDPGQTDPIDTYRTNVEATINLLELSRNAHQSVRFIYLSSETIYGEADAYPTKEQDHFRPDTAYAASKVAGDVLTQQCHGLRTVVIRSGMGYGPRSPPSQVVTKFFLKAMRGEPLLFPVGNIKHPTRDVNYIQNFVEGIATLLKHPRLSGVYNLGSGKETSLVTIAKEICQLTDAKIEYTDKFTYRPHEEGKRTWMDCTKALQEFGYYPRWTLEAGLAETYRWLKENPTYFK